MICFSPFLHEPQHEADIDADASRDRAVEADVGREGIPVAVEGQADELALAVKHRATAVASRDVIGGEEAEG